MGCCSEVMLLGNIVAMMLNCCLVLLVLHGNTARNLLHNQHAAEVILGGGMHLYRDRGKLLTRKNSVEYS